jgi:hypothetical protein
MDGMGPTAQGFVFLSYSNPHFSLLLAGFKQKKDTFHVNLCSNGRFVIVQRRTLARPRCANFYCPKKALVVIQMYSTLVRFLLTKVL